MQRSELEQVIRESGEIADDDEFITRHNGSEQAGDRYDKACEKYGEVIKTSQMIRL
jgi:hypothetical protein